MGFSDLMSKATQAGKRLKSKFSSSPGGLDSSVKYYGVTEANMNDKALNERMSSERTTSHRQQLSDSSMSLDQKFQEGERRAGMRKWAASLTRQPPTVSQQEHIRRSLETPELEGLPESRLKKQKQSQMRSPSFLTNRS